MTPPWRIAPRPPYRHALIVMAITMTMACLFVVSYSLALGRPIPHHIPAGLVGDTATQPKLVAQLETATHGGLAFRPYRSVSAAERAIDEQRIYAALVLDGRQARLLVASAAGSSVSRVLETAAMEISEGSSARLSVVDLHLLLATVTDLGIGALHGPFAELWATFAAQIAAAALFNATMLILIGRWAMLPTWGFFVVLGNASSGGAVASPLLPAYARFFGRFMPNAATVETIRNAVYFRHAQHLEPMLIEALWLVGALAAMMLATRFCRRTPSL